MYEQFSAHIPPFPFNLSNMLFYNTFEHVLISDFFLYILIFIFIPLNIQQVLEVNYNSLRYS